MTIADKILNKIRCAFCLNSGASNEKRVDGQTSSAYLCDDCSKANRQPKFVHRIDDDKVTELDITQPQPQPPVQEQQKQQTTTDDNAKEIAKAIDSDEKKKSTNNDAMLRNKRP